MLWVHCSLRLRARRAPSRYLFRPAESGAFVLEAPLFDVRLERDGTMTIRNIELASVARERRAEAALRALPAELDAIWNDSRLTEGERRGTIKALADETDTSTPAGKQAKALIDAFLSRRR